MKSSSKRELNRLSDVVKALERIASEGSDERVDEIASLLKRVDEESVESLLRILRMDFGEASRLFGTHLLKRIVSEALGSITPFKQSEVEELLEAGRVSEALRKRSRALISEGLSVNQAYNGMVEACRISGKGSIGFKAKKLASLLNKSSEEEALFIISVLIGERRGVGDETILKALEKAFNTRLDDAIGSGEFYEKVKRLIRECGTK